MEKYKKPYEGRRQDLPKVYSRNGAIYLIKVDHILNESSIYGGVTIPYIMPFERSINIDTYNDIIVEPYFCIDNVTGNTLTTGQFSEFTKS